MCVGKHTKTRTRIHALRVIHNSAKVAILVFDRFKKSRLRFESLALVSSI